MQNGAHGDWIKNCLLIWNFFEWLSHIVLHYQQRKIYESKTVCWLFLGYQNPKHHHPLVLDFLQISNYMPPIWCMYWIYHIHHSDEWHYQMLICTFFMTTLNISYKRTFQILYSVIIWVVFSLLCTLRPTTMVTILCINYGSHFNWIIHCLAIKILHPQYQWSRNVSRIGGPGPIATNTYNNILQGHS